MPTITAIAPRRTFTVALLCALFSTLLVVPAQAHHGSSGTQSVTADDRTSLELVAEAYMLDAHNDQRVEGRTRNGKTFSDVASGRRLQGWTDITTVARRWADRITFDHFKHNGDYSSQYGHWSGAGENIGIAAIHGVSRGTPSTSQVRGAAEYMMQNWWMSDGHRRNWMKANWEHFGVGAALTRMDVGASEDYWVLVGVTNFRDWNGTRVAGSGFTADGRTPPNESSHGTASKVVDAVGTTFRDVPSSHTFHANVEALAASGVTKGCGTSTFCPEDRVTRGQMAAFLTRALDLPKGAARFDDTRGHTFEAPAAALASSGITYGCATRRYCPDDYVTRGQMAAFLTRALGLPSGTARFDDTRGHLFEAPIAALARSGITKGCGGGNFCPDDHVTRGQMAAFLDRAGVLD